LKPGSVVGISKSMTPSPLDSAARIEPSPESAVFVTKYVLGRLRSSRHSKHNDRRLVSFARGFRRWALKVRPFVSRLLFNHKGHNENMHRSEAIKVFRLFHKLATSSFRTISQRPAKWW
jgi:hypothetical protein